MTWPPLARNCSTIPALNAFNVLISGIVSPVRPRPTVPAMLCDRGRRDVVVAVRSTKASAVVVVRAALRTAEISTG